MNISIFGSCVSRDAFELVTTHKFEILVYFARTSFASQACAPVENIEAIKSIQLNQSNFQKRLIHNDFNKDVTQLLIEQSEKNHFLIIDLIDDRFDLLRIDSTFITNSDEYSANGPTFDKCKSGSDEFIKKWEDGFNFLVSKINPEKIIVNCVFYADNLVGSDGFIYSYDEINYRNKYLMGRYEFMKSFIPESNFIYYDSFSSDPIHKWGPAPFHYTEATYKFFINKILSINIHYQIVNGTLDLKNLVIYCDLFSALECFKIYISKDNFSLSKNDALEEFKLDWLKDGKIEFANQFISGYFPFNRYPAIKIDNVIDWKLGQPGNNNLSWQLHSLFILKDLTKAYSLTNNKLFLDAGFNICIDWGNSNIKELPPSIFSFNDHSTANRLLNISCFYNFIASENIYSLQNLEKLREIIIFNQLILSSNKLYSKNTNHGLDQSYYLFLSTLLLPSCPGNEQLKSLSLSRLEMEVTTQFSDEAIHVENSPQYHYYILIHVLKIDNLVYLATKRRMIKDYYNFLNKGLLFLICLIRPDKNIPLIGESTKCSPSLHEDILSESVYFNIYKNTISYQDKWQVGLNLNNVFYKTGYAIFKSSDCTVPINDSIHAIFKCGFLNSYHRQDDDNSFLIFGFGEDWIIDGGLYLHDHGNHIREYLRSPYGHNLLVPKGITTSRVFDNVKSKIIAYDSNDFKASVTGFTNQYLNSTYSRTLRYDNRLSFSITEELCCPSTDFYNLIFHIPRNKEIIINGSNFYIYSKKSRKKLNFSFNKNDITLINNEKTSEVFMNIYSESYGELIDCQTVNVTLNKSSINNINYNFYFSDSE